MRPIDGKVPGPGDSRARSLEHRHGLLANREYRPRIDAQRAFEHCEPEIIKKGDEISGGKYLALPTIAEIVREAGRTAAIAGTKSVVFLHDRHAAWTTAASRDSFTKFAAAVKA
jgi:hypothetical protein